jgi:hypothetical protein
MCGIISYSMSNIELGVSTGQILAAENARRDGNNGVAVSLVEKAYSFGENSLDTFSDLSPEDQTRFLMAVRILGVAHLSLARNESNSGIFLTMLAKTHNIVDDMYMHPDVWKAAQLTRQDLLGNPNDYAAEMQRDRAKYLHTLFQITGDSTYLTQAMDTLDWVIEHASNPSIKTLAEFEKARFDLEATPQDEKVEAFNRFSHAYDKAHEGSAGNVERQATITAWFLVEADALGIAKDDAMLMTAVARYNEIVDVDTDLATLLEREFDKREHAYEDMQRLREELPEYFNPSDYELVA